MKGHIRWLIIILVITLISLWMSLPNPGIHLDLNGDGELEIDHSIDIRYGLDLRGGLRVLLSADLPADQVTGGDMETARRIVENRVNALGVVEPVIQLQEGSNRLVVELPGISDPELAISTIRDTGLLEFVDFSGISDAQTWENRRILTTEQAAIQEAQNAASGDNASTTDTTTNTDNADGTDTTSTQIYSNPRTGLPFTTVMTGRWLSGASPQYDAQRGWMINFTLKTEIEGEQSPFGAFTASHIGQPMAIVLDGEVMSAPTIQAQLTDGGVITGNFTQQEAETLATVLRYGALPVPLRVESIESVGPTLGAISIDRSIRAGIIGVITVLTFMLVYYRMTGVAADLALLVFVLMNFALFKFIPITLTLPAITGFLISIGTAVDGNILIFERMKEELRNGRTLDQSVRAGFDRAWTSIRDSNLSTMIICVILYLFGSTFGAGAVRGFAVTLFLGLLLNLFTAVIVTRTFLALIMQAVGGLLERSKWLVPGYVPMESKTSAPQKATDAAGR